MKRIVLFLFIVIISSIIIGGDAKATQKPNKLGFYSNSQKDITHDIDLNGEVCLLPDSVVLNFKGGIIKNGTIIGNNTKIICDEYAFDNVIIQGSWNIPEISSKWFKNASEENVLKNVMALTNPTVKNKVVITEGDYTVSVSKEGQSCLLVGSNTELQINGNIRLNPNSFSSYNIVHAKGENIKITGKGTIIGDKHTHTGTTGEWGMGVNVRKGKNVSVNGLTIRDCWGDCIYVGTLSENVKIDNCTLIDGRRQGISVTSANGVYISNCKISRVRGTAPQYGIDIEPNQGDTVDNIMIENVSVFDCYGGILTYGRAKNARIGSVILKECKVYDCEAKYPLYFCAGKIVDVKKCYVSSGERTAILFQDIDCSNAKNNTIKSSNKQPIKILLGKKNKISGNTIIK